MPIRLLIAEDEALLRTAIPDLLNAVAPGAVETVAQCATRGEAMRCAHALAPDAILLDLRMPDAEGGPCRLSGAETIRSLLRQNSSSRIVCLTSHEEAVLVRACLDAGAHGFLGKGCLPQEIWNAIRAVRAGWVYVEPRLRAGIQALDPGALDSVRAQVSAGRRGEVLRLLLEGLSPSDIAKALPICKQQVDKRIAELKKILGTTTHIGIYLRCRELGLVRE